MFQSSIRMGAIAAASVTLQLLLAAGPTSAQPTAEQQSALRNNCRSDFMSHCSGVTPGGAQALQCLQRNVAKLSPGCQGAVNALSPRPAPQQAAPAAAPTAPAAAAARPPVATPAMPAAESASAPPPAAPATAARSGAPTPEQQAALRQLCGTDYMAKCSHVAPASHQALQCLQSHSAELSANCRDALTLFSPGSTPQPAAAPASAPAPARAATPAAAPA
ncbi:MAG: cysteine rich repeat-containing protein, partial [Xanthobacteraceae bacterium]|nr:cysteine rich repeat-containing protein [Xanthobacteraceae bacterium]